MGKMWSMQKRDEKKLPRYCAQQEEHLKFWDCPKMNRRDMNCPKI